MGQHIDEPRQVDVLLDLAKPLIEGSAFCRRLDGCNTTGFLMTEVPVEKSLRPNSNLRPVTLPGDRVEIQRHLTDPQFVDEIWHTLVAAGPLEDFR